MPVGQPKLQVHLQEGEALGPDVHRRRWRGRDCWEAFRRDAPGPMPLVCSSSGGQRKERKLLK